MNVYIALLRGINVGGRKVILMADLKRVFENLGFPKVTTYIQSGNVIFRSEKKSELELENRINSGIKRSFHFDVKVIVKDLNEIAEIVRRNPFQEKELKPGEKIYFTLLYQKPANERITDLNKTRNDIDGFQVIDRTVYILCRKGYGKTLYNKNFIEKVLKVDATSRNLETMKKLTEIGNSL